MPMLNRSTLVAAVISLLPLSAASGDDPNSGDTKPENDQPGLLKDIASAPFPLPITRVMDLLERQIRYIADRERLIIAFGRGDYEAALKGLRGLADQGDGIAQLYMGVVNDRGYGVNPDPTKAVAWYRKAAEQGIVEAQNNLGVHYTNGQGVPAGYLQAYKWFYLAAAQGNAQAAINRDVLAQRMSAAEIAAARQLALSWIADHGNDPRYQSADRNQ